MEKNEAAAHELGAELSAIGLDAEVSGKGVHWHVDVRRHDSNRKLRVHVFWYERALHGLMLGMNAANARTALRGKVSPYEGAEFLVRLGEGETRFAEGRSRTLADAVTCARLWMSGVALGELVVETPFIDEGPRALRALAAGLDPTLRREIGDALWVYGDGRSCRVTVARGGGQVACAYFLGQAQVALAGEIGDVRSAVEAWLGARVPIGELAARVPEAVLERHAEVLERDPAHWHWLHFAERIADPSDVLAPLSKLLEALAQSPVATRFYTYSSLNRLCFSASSHYPWVDRGLPVVAPVPDGQCVVETNGTHHRVEATRAVELVEEALRACEVEPFFGSEPHHQLPVLTSMLEQTGSTLRPELTQHTEWFQLTVGAGERCCRVSGNAVSFGYGSGDELSATWLGLEDAVAAIRRYLEQGASLEALSTDPRAVHVARYHPKDASRIF